MIILDSFSKLILDNLHEGVYILDMNKTIIYCNKSAEKSIGYTSEDLIGSSCKDIICFTPDKENQNCDTDCSISQSFLTGEINESTMFFSTKNSHNIPIHLKIVPTKDQSEKITGVIIFFVSTVNSSIGTEKINELIKFSFLDPVTELPNRRYLETKLQSILEEIQKTKISVEVLVFEVQDLKLLNDKYGDKTVDTILKIVAKTLASNVKLNSTIGRWSGNKFMIILPEPKNGFVLLIANKLQMLINNAFAKEKENNITIETICAGSRVKNIDDINSLTKRIENIIVDAKKDNLTLKIDES